MEAHRYEKAIPILRALLDRPEIEGKQRLQLSYGIALRCTGHRSEAMSTFGVAVSGDDSELKQMAWRYLADYETAQ